jgi:hypothetical protein
VSNVPRFCPARITQMTFGRRVMAIGRTALPVLEAGFIMPRFVISVLMHWTSSCQDSDDTANTDNTAAVSGRTFFKESRREIDSSTPMTSIKNCHNRFLSFIQDNEVPVVAGASYHRVLNMRRHIRYHVPLDIGKYSCFGINRNWLPPQKRSGPQRSLRGLLADHNAWPPQPTPHPMA